MTRFHRICPFRLEPPEPLEARLALAAIVQFTEIDGDLVRLRSSRGNAEALVAALRFDDSALDSRLKSIDLTDPVFEGARVSLIAMKPIGGTGDGRVVVVGILAEGRNLRQIYINGELRGPVIAKSVTALTVTGAAIRTQDRRPPAPKPYLLTTHMDLVPKRGRLPDNAVVYGLIAPNQGTFQSCDRIHGAPGRLSTLKLMDKGNARTVRPFVKNVTMIEHTLLGHTVVDTSRYSGVGEELIVAGDAQKGHKLTLLNADSSTRFGIATSSPETLAVTLANAHDEVLRLRLDRAGGTADEATINYAGLVNDIASLDIVTSGKNHTDINATSNVSFVKVTGSGRNFLTFSDDGFGRQSIASSGLVIDGSTVTGDSTYFVGSYYSSDLILKGAEASGVRTYLGLRILGNQQLATLSNVQGLVIQKGSSGILDMNSSKDIRFLELQTSATRPGELHAVATLIDTAALQSIQYVGGGDSGSQRFPGIRITGPSSLPGPSDRLDINYTNRGTPLLPSSGVEMADPILLDGAEQVRLELGDSIGLNGHLSLPQVGGEGMKSLTIVNPSHGFSDIGLVSTGGQAGSLDEFDASGVQGPLAVRFDTASLAVEVKMVTADSNANIVIDGQQASNLIAIDFGNGDNRLDTALLTAQFNVKAGNGNSTLNNGSGRNIIGVGNGSNRISTGDGYDTIRFGAGANRITSGFGSDNFFIGQENGGNLDGLTQILVADAGVSDDLIHYRFNGSSNQVASLTGSQSVAEFQQKVMDLIADSDVAASGPGAYYEVVANPSGPMTLIYQNTGDMSRNVILAVSGSHYPALSDNVLSID